MRRKSTKITAMVLSAAMIATAVPAYGASDLESIEIRAEDDGSIEAEDESGAAEETAKASGDVQWVLSQDKNYWQKQEDLSFTDWDASNHESLYIDVDETITYQEMAENAWGGCFNERGWKYLSELSEEDRNHILDLLFDPDEPDGLHLTMGRTPIAASDFAIDLYSYDETTDDYELKDFSIDRDKTTLIPYIKEALKRNPDLKIWASPWSPPSWMKKGQTDSNPLIGGEIEYTDANMKAYAQYFVKYLEAYKAEGIDIFAVCPQNEPTMWTAYTSCVWTGDQLCGFIRDYLGPALEGTGIEIYLGTFTNSLDKLMDPTLNDPECRKYISGVGFQWWSWMKAHSLYETGFDLDMMQTETMCGDGWNNWSYAENQFDIFWSYLENGITSYNLWNMVLEFDGVNRGGHNTAANPWPQNAPITVNENTKEYQLNPQYYQMKHFTEFVKAGARRIETSGTYCDGYREGDAESDNSYTAPCRDIAFRNRDGLLVVEVKNGSNQDKTVDIRFGNKKVTAVLPPHSINSFTTQGTPLTGSETDMHETIGQENVKTVLSKLSGKCMCVEGDVVAQGRAVIQWAYNGEANQTWYITENGDGTVKFFNIKSRKLLAVEGGNTAAGAKPIVWSDENGDDQKWYMEKDESTGCYRFKNYKSGLYLTVSDAENMQITQQPLDVNSDGQLWNVTAEAKAPAVSHLKTDKTELESAVNAALPETEKDKYTAESWSSYAKALESAKEILADRNANWKQVENAVKALEEAKAALKEPAAPTPTEKPEKDIHKDHVGKTFMVKDLKYKVVKDDGKVQEVRVTSLRNKKLKKLVIPKTVKHPEWKETFKVTSVKAKAFKGAAITKVTVGDNVKIIGPNAFLNCRKLKSAVIGKNVQNIGTKAFFGCGKLTKITIKSTALKTVKANAFKKVSKKAVIKVPKGKKAAYGKKLKGKMTSGIKIK